jgi:hypothetical protein
LVSPHDGSIDGPWRFEYMSTRLPHLFRSTANMFARHCHRKVEKRGGGEYRKRHRVQVERMAGVLRFIMSGLRRGRRRECLGCDTHDPDSSVRAI